MNNFIFYAPTQILFGKDQIRNLGKQVKTHSSRVLLVYGKGSILRNGIYQATVEQLQTEGISYFELGGVDPNPRLSTVNAGAALCRQHNLTFVLGVGGGSVIDCAKAIAAATCYDGDPWDFWTSRTPLTKALPVGAVLTLTATGSEMNGTSVITDERTEDKRGFGHGLLYPVFSILDPTYTFSVPQDQTAAGTADILTHVFEFYFSQEKNAYLIDAISEAVMKTCVRYGPVAYHNPADYEARANLMWAGSLALNGLVKTGKTFDGFCHMVEHPLSALYDLTHGVGLAILAPHWMEYVLDETTVDKLGAFARNVWGHNLADPYELARAGIASLREFYRSLGLPACLNEVGIDDARFDEIVEKALRGGTQGHFKVLSPQDIHNILRRAL